MNRIEDSTVPQAVAKEPPGRGKRRGSKTAVKQVTQPRLQRSAKAAKRLSPATSLPKTPSSREAATTSPSDDAQPAPKDRAELPGRRAARDAPSIIGALRRLRAAAANYIRPPVPAHPGHHAPPEQAGQATPPAPEPAPTSPAALATSPDTPTRQTGAAHSTPPAPQARNAPDLPDAPADIIPPALRQRYLVIDDKFYFRDRDQTLAFEDQGKRIATAHDDADVAQSMVTLAQAKGWTSLKLRGSDDFKREAWLAAALQGMEVSGYRPNDIDRARLAERQNERAQGRSNTIERKLPEARPLPAQAAPAVTPVDETPAAEEGARQLGKRQQRAVDALAAYLRQRGDSDQAIDMTVALASEQMLQRRAHFGRLVEHGAAPYKNDPDQEDSYYVTLRTERGRQTIWGVDLARAIGDSGVSIGDDILLSKCGARNVTVPVVERDPSGRRAGGRTYLDTHRNDWEVSSLDGARDFMSAKDKAEKGAAGPAVAPPRAPAPPRQPVASQPAHAHEPEPSRSR